MKKHKKQRHRKIVPIKDSIRFNSYGSLGRGGLVNPVAGAGTYSDKSQSAFYVPTYINSREVLEIVYVESWAASRFITIYPDSMLQIPRIFEGEDEESTKNYSKYLKTFSLDTLLKYTMYAGKLYGSAFLVFITKENDLTKPLDLNYLTKGDLCKILLYDRFSVSYNLVNNKYYDQDIYHISSRQGASFDIHKSRVLRIDGIKPMVSDGWSVYDILYGVSELVQVYQDIMQSDQISRFTTQLMSEASIPVFKIEGFKEAITAGQSNIDMTDQVSLQDLSTHMNATKSNYNAIYMDKDDDFTRQEVNLSGVSLIMDAFADRLASAVAVPSTVFLGTSPKGMNATGESDLKIFADRVSSKQNSELRRYYEFCDKIMLRTFGQPLELTYNFPSLIETSGKSKAETLNLKTTSIVSLVQNEIISTDEARKILDGDPIIGTLEDNAFDFSEALQKPNNAPSQINNENIDKPAQTNT